jgi:predicted nucleic acid-binding protein
MLVLDNSMFAAALFADEQHPFAVSLYQLVLEGEETVKVPPVFLYEACTVVLNAIRRKRINEKAKQDYLQLIYEFPLHIDTCQPMADIVGLACTHGLTIYDASYLELAKRELLPLATFDKALIIAAKKEKIPLLTIALRDCS